MYKSLVEDPPPSSFDAAALREAIARRLHRRAEAEGKITVPAVPSMVDEYVKMCEKIFAGMGIQYTVEQSAQLKRVLQSELTKAYKTSPRSVVVIEFNAPWGTTLNYRVKADWLTIEEDYDRWVAIRPPPLFGSEPDARVCALADEAADPKTHRVLDIGAGTGRNALALARRGHPVDAVEMTAKFAETIRSEAEAESLGVRVIQARRLHRHGWCRVGIPADCGLRGGTRLPHAVAVARAFRTVRPAAGSRRTLGAQHLPAAPGLHPR